MVFTELAPYIICIVITALITLYFVYIENVHFVGGIIGAIIIGFIGGLVGNFFLDKLAALFEKYINIFAVAAGVFITLRIFAAVGPKFRKPQ